MIKSNTHYTYCHIRLDTNELFYIGIGKHQKKWKHARANSTNDRNNFWRKIVAKAGAYDIVIISDNLTEEQAKSEETKLIRRHGRRDIGIGPLVNLTDGGEGRYNYSEETIQKLSQGKLGVLNPAFGTTHTDEWKQYMSAKFKGEGNPNFGKPLPAWHKEINRKAQLGRIKSEATRQKLSQSLTGLKRSQAFKELMSVQKSKPILDTATGITYSNAAEVAVLFGLNRSTLKAWLNGQNHNKSTFIYK